MKSFYFGPNDKHPFVIGGDYDVYFERINPSITHFNWGSGNGWRGGWTNEELPYSVTQTMNHATYKNNGDFVCWHINHSRYGNRWVRVGRDQSLMNISSMCPKGRWDWTKGERYLTAYMTAIEKVHQAHIDAGDLDYFGFHIVDVYKTLLQHQNQHAFFTSEYDRFPIGLQWRAFIENLIESGIPFIWTDVAWPNQVDHDLMREHHGQEIDLGWLNGEALSPLKKFDVGADVPLYTRRYKKTGPDKYWAARRVTVNPNPYPVRNIPARTGISKFAWVWAKEREEMLEKDMGL